MIRPWGNQYGRRLGNPTPPDPSALLSQARQPSQTRRPAAPTGPLQPVEITRDAILDRSHPSSYSVVFDQNHHLLTIIKVDCSGIAATGYAQSPRTGMLYRFVQTGKIRPGQPTVRVRAIPAVDTGDLAGTLRFDPASGTVPGIISKEIACSPDSAVLHPDCPPGVLRQLLQHPDPEIASLAAHHPALPSADRAMWQLAH